MKIGGKCEVKRPAVVSLRFCYLPLLFTPSNYQLAYKIRRKMNEG